MAFSQSFYVREFLFYAGFPQEKLVGEGSILKALLPGFARTELKSGLAYYFI